ncbi:hypothetical protein CORT_0B01600 [Candida orthopsilosis Co 90-125]|uniref:Uncharacterized protein n=1 Tax=Candida orthopsilosis (strain 90-125) TaxID=1136231 RepID=H8X0J0_CANO9|nr:hypothetical protein CORT_0B01600 [Candida orthopsilosis Co 90-125]CCG21879.1 hypothetical protein CORT_0B01600 [Candida orthopsilosis Co 90-125]
MDNSLRSLIKTYELESSTLPVHHHQEFELASTSQPLSQRSNYMPYSNNGNSTRNGQKYVPPHRLKSKKEANENHSTKNGTHLPGEDELTKRQERFNSKNVTNLTEEEKLVKRRERFSTKNDKRKQPHNYGLISRGEDTRLKDSEALREEYFLVILHQFIKYTSTNTSKSLSEAFKRVRDSNPKDFENAQALKSNIENNKQTITMESLTMSLRKLRESLLHLKPSPFHKKVFLFSTRISYCCGQYQTYIPSINYLLLYKNDLKLSNLETEEVAVILTLHLTHFNNNTPKAVQVYFRYIPNRKDVLQIIRCWIQKDYYNWNKIYNSMESFAVKAMMRLGLPKMLNHMTKSLSSSYFTMKKSVIESELLPDDVEYEELINNYKVNWTVDDGGVVTLRRRQSKKEK